MRATLTRSTWLVLLIPAAASLAGLFPVLSFGFLSDDFWWATLFDQSSTVARVDWGEVWRDFGGPWLGGEASAFYRPLSTVALALNLDFGGGSPLPFHAWNLAQHGGSSVLCGMLCALCAPARPRLAALLGGTLFALHPAAVEPAAWASCVTSTQEVLCRLGAMTGYALFLSSGRRRFWFLSLIAALAALLTKESGLMLPVSIVVVHLLHPIRTPVRAAVLHIAPFVILALAYVGLRLVLPGLVVALGPDTNPFLDELTTTLPTKFWALLFPFDLGAASLLTSPGFWIVLATCGLTVLVAATPSGCGLRVPALGLAWLVILFLPSAPFPVLPSYFGARMIYGTVASLALTLMVVLGSTRAPVWWTRLALLGVALMVASFARVSRMRLADYERAYDEMASFRAEIARLGKQRTATRPLAMLTVPRAKDGILRIAPACAFAAGQIPWASHDIPLVNLAFVLERSDESRELHMDASPLRALHELGATLTSWDSVNARSIVEEPTRDRLPRLARQPGSLVWTLAQPASPWAIEAVEVRGPAALRRGTLRWRAASSPIAHEIAFAAGRADGTDTVVPIDLTHDLAFLTARILGGVASLELALEGNVDPASVGLRPVERVPELPVPARLEGGRIAIEDLTRRIPIPSPPAGDARMRLVLVSPAAGHVLPLEGGTLHLTNRVELALLWLLRCSRRPTCYIWFEATSPGGRAWRSRVDWFLLTQRGPRRRRSDLLQDR